MQGFFGRGKDLDWRNLRDVQVLAAMSAPSNSQLLPDARLISLFTVLGLQMPSTDSLEVMYTSILSKHAEDLAPDIQGQPF